MPVRRPPYILSSVHALRCAQAFRDMAEAAEKGKIIGAAVTAIAPNNGVKAWLSGICEHNIPLSVYAVRKLEMKLLSEP